MSPFNPPTPLPNSFRDNPSLSNAYNVVAQYLTGLITLSSLTKYYEIYIDADTITYRARRGDLGDIVDSDTDIGALLNRLFTGGGVHCHLKTMGTYNQATTILPPTNSVLTGQGESTIILATQSLGTTSFQIDLFNAGAGRKWVLVWGVTFDANNVAYGCIRTCGLTSDTSQWNWWFEVEGRNFVTVGMDFEDQSSAGGTRQHAQFTKMGPGKTTTPNRGYEIRCNDLDIRWFDAFRITDVGIWVAPRGVLGDKSVGTWWLMNGHISCAGYVSGGVSPDNQPVNIYITASVTVGTIKDCYIDNIHRYGIYAKPDVGNKLSQLNIKDNHFNGNKLSDAAGSDLAVAVVLDATNVGPSDIYAVSMIDNNLGNSYSTANPTRGRWKAFISLRGGIITGANYVTLQGNHGKGCLNDWDPAGTRPDMIGRFNYLQPAANNQSLGKFTSFSKLVDFMVQSNLLVNPSLLTDTNADLIPDSWILTASSLTGVYPGDGSWEAHYPSVGQFLYQDVPAIAGLVYSIGVDAQLISGPDPLRLTLQFFDESSTIIGGSPNATGGGSGSYASVKLENRLAPVDDLTSHGTGSMALAGTTLTAASGTFNTNDVGLWVTVEGAGSADGTVDLLTTIASFTDSTHVVLTNPCLNSSGVSGVLWTLSDKGTVGSGSSGTTLVAATGVFSSSVVNQTIILQGANADGTDFITTVKTFTDSTHVVLNASIPVVHAGNNWLISSLLAGHGDVVRVRISLRQNANNSNVIRYKNAVLVQAATVPSVLGAVSSYVIPHNLPGAPNTVRLTPKNAVAAQAQASSSWAVAVDAINITLTTPSITGPAWWVEANR